METLHIACNLKTKGINDFFKKNNHKTKSHFVRQTKEHRENCPDPGGKKLPTIFSGSPY